MWGELFSAVGSAAGGSSSSGGGGGNPNKSGFDNFSGGNFGAVNFGSKAGGFNIDKETLMILGAVAIVLFVVTKG